MIFLKRRAMMSRASFNYKTVSGIGSAVLENCVETRFKRLSLSGNSTQTTTKGLQLLDKTKIPTPQAGVAYYNMQVEEGKYTLSTKYRRANQKDLFLLAGEVDTGASSNINGVDSTISRTVESINGYITIGYRKGENGVNPFDFETMLNKGDTHLSYEPYTGGKPSPSPEYSQKIVSVGKKSKNLFDISKVKSSMAVDINIENSTITLPIGGAIYLNKLKDICTELNAGDEIYVFAETTGTRKFFTFYNPTINSPLFNFGEKITISEAMLDSSFLLYSDSNKEVVVSDIMVTKTNNDTYEPYSDKFLVDVEVTGKNLFNPKSKDYVQTTYRHYIVNKDNYPITITLIDKENSADISGVSLGYSGNSESLGSDLTWLVSSNNITKIKTTRAKCIAIYPPKDETLQKLLNRFDIQVEYGEESTPYEPYHEPQTVQLQLDEPLRGIGEYKDVVTKDGILRKIGHLEIKGGLIWNDWGNRFRIIVYVEKGVIIYSKYLCNYTNDVKNFGNQDYVYLYFTRKQVEAIGINTNDTLEVANKKLNEIVANKPIVIEYPLKTPIFVPFPQETKLALENLHANDGSTIISVDSGNVQAGIEVEYAVKE